MRTSFFLISMSLLMVACGPFSNYGKFLRADQNNGRPYLDSDAIAAALQPLIQECNQDSDCKIGGIPTWDSCSARISPNEEMGAYLVGKEVEFQAFKADLKAAFDVLSVETPKYVCQATPDHSDPARASMDPAISFYKRSEPVARCDLKRCVAEVQNTADFVKGVQVDVRRDRLGPQGSARKGLMAVVSGNVIRYGLAGFDLSGISNPQPNDLFYGFSFSTNSPNPDYSVLTQLPAAEVQPILNAAAPVKFCSRAPFSYAGYGVGVPAIYCGSYSLGINGLYNDRAGYNWLRLCDSESVTAAKTVAQLLKGLIASKITNLPTEGIDALNDLGAWEPQTSSPQGLNCAL